MPWGEGGTQLPASYLSLTQRGVALSRPLRGRNLHRSMKEAVDGGRQGPAEEPGMQESPS